MDGGSDGFEDGIGVGLLEGDGVSPASVGELVTGDRVGEYVGLGLGLFDGLSVG